MIRTLRRLARAEQGSALVELALVMALLGLPLLLGTAEFGPLLYDSAEVESAAHAGALYGMQSPIFAADLPGIIQAAQLEAADFGQALTVTSMTYWVCSNAIAGTQYTGVDGFIVAQLACLGANNHVVQLVQVTTTLQVTPAIHCPGLPATFTLTGSSVMEVQI